MLAYVFWHWPRPGVSAAEYAARLSTFHRALAARPPGGWRGSRSFAVAGGVPGLAPEGPLFEDWYFVDDFASLGALNEAAAGGEVLAPHDGIARLAAGGAGGVYRLRTERLARVTHTAWLSKPAPVSYAAFFAGLPAGTEVWQRQMVLGRRRRWR